MTCRPPPRFVAALVLLCICSIQSACSAIRSPFDNYRDGLHAALLAVSDVDPRGGQGRLSNADQDLFSDWGYNHNQLLLAREHMISSINGYVAHWLRLEGASEVPTDSGDEG